MTAWCWLNLALRAPKTRPQLSSATCETASADFLFYYFFPTCLKAINFDTRFKSRLLALNIVLWCFWFELSDNLIVQVRSWALYVVLQVDVVSHSPAAPAFWILISLLAFTLLLLSFIGLYTMLSLTLTSRHQGCKAEWELNTLSFADKTPQHQKTQRSYGNSNSNSMQQQPWYHYHHHHQYHHHYHRYHHSHHQQHNMFIFIFIFISIFIFIFIFNKNDDVDNNSSNSSRNNKKKDNSNNIIAKSNNSNSHEDWHTAGWISIVIAKPSPFVLGSSMNLHKRGSFRVL